MNLTKIFNNSSYFPFFGKVGSLLLLLVGLSVQSFGQMYIGKHTTVSIQEGTVVHISENKNEKAHTAKIYVAENAKIVNLAKDSSVEIVYLKNEEKPEKNKELIAQNKSKKPLQPPLKETDAQPETGKSVLSFNSVPATPSALMHLDATSKLALAQNTNSAGKLFPKKKSNNNNSIISFLLNDDQPITNSSNELLLIQQIGLEGHITRPPPFQIA